MRKLLLTACAAALLPLAPPTAATAAPLPEPGSGTTTTTTATTATVEGPHAGGLDRESLERALSDLRDAGAPAVLAEARRGNESWTAARGTDVRPTDRVRVASVTKSMVATVLLQLVEEGRVRLDDPVERYLPGVLPYQETITVRNLMGHTSGIPEYIIDAIYPSVARGSAEDVRTNRYRAYSPRQLVRLATARPLLFPPGEGFEYSNANYVLLGMLVERVTGNPAESELERRVLRPAGMRDSYVPRHSPRIEGPHPRGNYATGDPEEPLLDTTELSPTQFWTAGAVISTAHDLNRFYRAMFDGTLLSPAMAAEARRLNDTGTALYGLGVLGLEVPPDCSAVPGGVVYGHTGGSLGYTTFSFSTPDGGRQVTFTYTLDATLDPATGERIGTAAQELGVAAICASE